MRRKNRFLIIISCIFMLSGCKNTDEKFRSYIREKCYFNGKDSCYINLKNVFEIDYDTMYVFDEYTQLQGIQLILGIKNYNSSNWLMPVGFLVEDSHKKIILIKNRRIVYEEDFEPGWQSFDGGIIVEKVGTFDGEPFTHYATMYVSPVFLVRKIENHEGVTNKYFYALDNVHKKSTTR